MNNAPQHNKTIYRAILGVITGGLVGLMLVAMALNNREQGRAAGPIDQAGNAVVAEHPVYTIAAISIIGGVIGVIVQ